MMDNSREQILSSVRSALGRNASSSVSPIMSTARFPARQSGDTREELELFLTEAAKVGVKTQVLDGVPALATALAEMVATEQIKQATLWQTYEIKALGIEQTLRELGIAIISPYAPNQDVAVCELGVTGVDFALPETGTLVLRSSVERPRTVSLLPRVHLAILRPAALRADLHQVLLAAKNEGYFVFITGPSRTSDIELTLTVGVHGPQIVYVWVLP
jgi:L-lactate dehydrogenase complex protein LldG